jgi:hypothetical protein
MSGLPSEGGTGSEFQFTGLSQSDREQLVELSGNQAKGSAFVTADTFTLSALGAGLDLTGAWAQRGAEDGMTATNILGWRQITTGGRDEHVKIVQAGYLFPLGHRATLITITDRVLAPDPVSPTTHATAYLQTIRFIRVTEQVKTYPAPGQPYGLGAWPFSSVTVVTDKTPDLDPPAASNNLGSFTGDSADYAQAFFPTTDGGLVVEFTLQLIDQNGTEITTQVPLVFVTAQGPSPDTLNQYSYSDMAGVAAAYNGLGQSSVPSPWVTGTVAGTPFMFAPEVEVNATQYPGQTTHPLLGLTFGAATSQTVPTATTGVGAGTPQYVPPVADPASASQLSPDDQPSFYPTILYANVRLPAAESLSRAPLNDTAESGPGGVRVFFYGPFVTDGFTTAPASGPLLPARSFPRGLTDPTGSTNPGSVYGGLLTPPNLQFPADAVGGLANPNLAISGLSAAAGAIGGALDQYAQNATALISDYFGSVLNSSFLGGLTLDKILGAFLNDLGVPEISRTISGETATVSYTLTGSLSNWMDIFVPNGDGQFTLTATVTITPSSTTFEVSGSIDAFTIYILGNGGDGIISIGFGTDSEPGATFTSGSGQKSNIQVNVQNPTFLGALSFVNTLEQFLSNIGGSGVSIDVEPTEISASVSLSLPSVGCGVFNLMNMSLSANITIPFLGNPTTATFAFCSQEQPFTLTVMCFGGGGYVTVTVGLHNVESFTASLDFEGQLALDLGVASGSVSASAGFTFTYTSAPANPDGATLTAFVNITGEVSVLGIISISITLQLQLTYQSDGNICTGTATMTVSVSICFLSISVPITVSKQFSGPSQQQGGPEIPRRVGTRGVQDDALTSAQAASITTFEDEYGAVDGTGPATWADYCSAFAG